MADDSAWSPAVTRRSEPSWPTVIATTVRLWVDRHPVSRLKVTGWRLLALLRCGVLGGAGAVTGGGFAAAPPAPPPRGRRAARAAPPPPPPISGSLQAATAARTTAARWIAGQVS